VVAGAGARRWHGDRLPRDARLGAGPPAVFRDAFSRPLAGHELHNTEQDIVYKGFPPPGEKDPAQRAQIEGRQLVGTFASASWTHRWW
jgi:hypothetical protein